jgi:undecaprenyl-phosphate 4-deoxy-4-formamido-L-arabinose transferase
MYSVIIPCYNSSRSIREVVEQTAITLKELERVPFEFVLVDDHSPDGGATLRELRALADDYPYVTAIELAQNAGQHNAIMAGLHHTKGERIMGMDDDMQTHPSQVFKLIEKMEEGYDVVYGVYPESKNGFFKRLSSNLNQFSSRILLDIPKDIKATNFWIITDKVRDEAIKYSSFNPVIDAIFYQVTQNFGSVEVEHHKRESGKSGYTFRKLLRLWLSYWNYSVVPLRISFFIGALSATLGLAITIWLIYKKITDPLLPMGWASTLCLMTLLFGAVLMVLGVVGEYLGKAILILNKTPQYIVREELNTDEES